MRQEDTLFNPLANEVEANVDVLRPNVIFGFRGERDSAGVVHVEDDGEQDRDVKLRDEGFQPEALLQDVGDGHVLRLSRRQGMRDLLLGNVSYKAPGKELGIARN